MTGFQSKRQASKDLLKQALDALDDALICCHIGTVESFPTAKDALNALIDWHVATALDPEVSSSAQALVDRGAAVAEPLIDDLTPAELRCGIALQLREIERLRLRVKALESAITESLRIAGNWPEGAQAVLEDALPTLGEYAAQKDSK